MSFQRLKNFFKSWVNKLKRNNIPTYFQPSENIVRAIFSPINLKKNGALNNNAFKPPAGLDEISVNRLSLTSIDFCKTHSKKIENVEQDRSYHGFANLTVQEIHKVNCSIVYSPLPDNLFHADIQIGFIPQKGKPLPAEYQYKVQMLAKTSRFYIDPNPQSNIWTGGNII